MSVRVYLYLRTRTYLMAAKGHHIKSSHIPLMRLVAFVLLAYAFLNADALPKSSGENFCIFLLVPRHYHMLYALCFRHRSMYSEFEICEL